MLNSTFIPDETKKILNSAFARLKERVIWKLDTETMGGVAPNVLIQKWCPQQDILGHPNVKAFITHGGLLSLEESIYHEKPLLFIPGFADQFTNAARAVELKIGLQLDWPTLTEDDVV